MARMAKRRGASSFVCPPTEGETDRYLPPRAMKALLEFRLYTIESQIESLYRRTADDVHSPTHWSWRRTRKNEERLASWTSINYLLSVREQIRQTLNNLGQ